MKKVATPKQTGQGGPKFENKVCGYFLACMLTGTSSFSGKPGIITRVDFQVAGDGWFFDDTLLTIDDNGAIGKVAVSIKSNQQITSKGLPKDLNRLLWEQYLHVSSKVFNRNSDSLCLVESPISATVSADLNTVLSQAKAQNADDLHKRLYIPGYSSKEKQKLYESFHCPDDLANSHDVNREETSNLLKHFLHFEMDFERVNSMWELRTIDLCRNLLQTKSEDEAKKLFEQLCKISQELSDVNGYLDIPVLLRRLRKDFRLGIPDHQPDWAKLKKHTIEKLSLIQNKLGKKLSIERTKSIEELNQKLESRPICLIEGLSGGGKTVLAKEYAEKKISGSTVVWFDAADFDGSIESDLQLGHPLTQVIKLVPDNDAYLFIDGAERLYHQKQQQRLSLLINTAISTNLPWKVIVTCPSDSVDRLLQSFYQHNLTTESINRVDIPALDDDIVLELAKQFPELGAFFMNKQVRKILNNLKLLDKILFNVGKIAAISEIGSPGETQLIDFIWQEEIENSQSGIQKSSFLKIVAEKQADRLLTGVSTAMFDPANISMADELRKAGFIKTEQQKIYFIHDLYSDWARYQLLLAHSENILSFLAAKSLLSPLWIKAIRLYGLSLLEKDLTGEAWKKTFDLFNDSSSQHAVVKNLLLESFFLSPNSYEILSKQKDLLFSEEGKLFKKLTKLFLISGTVANPEVVQIVKKIAGITETEASTLDRLPILPYWPDVLHFLHDNVEEALKLSLIPVANIATLWLEKIPLGFLFRKLASDIAFKAAQFIFGEQVKGVFVDDEITEPVYKGLLLGYNENKDLVSDLCLKICKRKKTDKEKNTEEKKQTIKAPSIMGRLSYPKREAKQWPDGPFERVDNTFQKLCLETNCLLPILASNPSLGKEILLAVLLDEPDDRYLGMQRFDDHYSIHNPLGWYPPFYLRGPFLRFLRMHPKEAIDFVVRITDFATVRWLENDRVVQKTEQSIAIHNDDKELIYYGDSYVFGWHKDIGNAPHSLVSILMAFEQFLYEEIENGRPIEKYIEYAINHSHSLAIVGLLITVAKLRPTLFFKELKMLLPVYILYIWDFQTTFGNSSLRKSDLPSSWGKNVEGWVQRRHRSFPLKDTLIYFFLSNTDFQALFTDIIPYWQEERKKTESEGSVDIYLLQMIPQFKRENYIDNIVDGKKYLEYKEPTEVSEYLKEGREKSEEMVLNNQVSWKMEKMIEDRLPFDLAGAEYLWTKIQQWQTEIEPSHIKHDYVLGSPLTNIFSSFSVLLNSENIWVNEHPEYLEWIKAFIENLIDQRLKNSDPEDRYGTSFDWNVKLASLLPLLWKKDVRDKSYRKSVAGILILFNDTTSSTFLSAAGNLFQWNEVEFVKAQNLFLLYHNELHQAFVNSYPQREQRLPMQEKYIDAFTNDTISCEFMEWPELMDFHKAKILLNSLPDFKVAGENGQRNYILFLIKQALKRMEARLTGRLEEVRDNEHTDEFDRTILIKVAECLPFLTTEEKPEMLWSEILKYGHLASDWVVVFFDAFFRLHLNNARIYPKIVELLNRMLVFTSKWTTWETAKSFKRWGDFRNCILGLDPKTIRVWQNDFSAFIKEADTLYRYWFNKNRFNPHTIESAMSFIVTPSGLSFLPEGLQHLKAFFSKSLENRNEKPPTGKVYVGHKELDDKLASTLSFLWEQKRELIKGNEEMFSTFRELLQYLVAMENVIAAEIQQKLVLA